MSVIPPEWAAVRAAARAMHDVTDDKGSLVRAFLNAGIPFVLGASISAPFADAVANGTIASEMVNGVLASVSAFGGILVGFLINLMLFTGRVQSRAETSFEVVREAVKRVKYLLVSQTSTLLAAIGMVVFTILWLALIALAVDQFIVVLVGAMLGGFTGLALVRTILLPFQIFELHEYTLDDAVEEAKLRIKTQLDLEGK
jgi:hypothetical protein